MAVDPTQQGIIRSGGGTPSDRGDFTAWQRDEAAAQMARRAAEEADQEYAERQATEMRGATVVNYTDEALSEEEQAAIYAEVPPPARMVPVPGGVVDVSTPELAEVAMRGGPSSHRLGAVPQVREPTVSGPRIITIIGDDLIGFAYGDERYDFLSGVQYKVPGHIADHLVRKRCAMG